MARKRREKEPFDVGYILGSYGFVYGETGGGCCEYDRELGAGAYVSVQNRDEPVIPKTFDEPVVVRVFFNPVDDEEPMFAFVFESFREFARALQDGNAFIGSIAQRKIGSTLFESRSASQDNRGVET